jgi:hypothetical protein
MIRDYLIEMNSLNFMRGENYEIKEQNLFVKITYKINLFIFKKSYLTIDELLYCCKLLDEFSILLENNFIEKNTNIVKLRIKISEFYLCMLGDKLFNKDIERASSINHFFQNENLTTNDIHYFMKKLPMSIQDFFKYRNR